MTLSSIPTIREQTANFAERGEIRKAIDTAFFGIWNDIDWHRRRTGNRPIGKEFIAAQLKVPPLKVLDLG